MIEHQIEWLMSEAWGVSGDEHAQDFARRVDAYLEAQQFETGLGSLEELPDIVREVYGRARTPQVPWRDLFRECLEKAVGKDSFPTPRAWAQVARNKPEDGVITPILSKPLVNRFIRTDGAIPIVNTEERTVKWHGYFIDEYVLMPPDKYKALIAINEAMMNSERDNGEQSEQND